MCRAQANPLIDQTNILMELFMAGGNYAAAGVPFPAHFEAAVEAAVEVEMKAARQILSTAESPLRVGGELRECGLHRGKLQIDTGPRTPNGHGK